MDNATLTIERLPAWADKLRSYQVFIDKELYGTVGESKSTSFEVPAGHHEVFLKIDWCSSQRAYVDLDPGQRVTLACQGNSTITAIFKTIFDSGDYIQFVPTDQEPLDTRSYEAS